MPEYTKRKLFFRVTKYQRPIVSLALCPALFLCILITVFVIYYQNELVNMILYTTKPISARIITQWGTIIIGTLWVSFFVLSILSCQISSNLVGAFERIMREMDDIIAGKERRIIRARPKDDLANELAKRINILIDSLPGPGHKSGSDGGSAGCNTNA